MQLLGHEHNSCLLVSAAAHVSCGASGSHPALRRLVAFDAAASLAVLQGGLVGWDALDSDLLDAAAACAAPPPGAAAARSATQVATQAPTAALPRLVTWAVCGTLL
jgi:hypothetical protein